MRLAATTGTVSNLFELARRDVGSGEIVTHLRDRWIEPLSRWMRDLNIQPIVRSIVNVGSRQANWDRVGSAAANQEAIQRAVAEVETFFDEAVSNHADWVAPFVGLSERGEVVFEWWNDERKLSLYIGPQFTEYVSSWGPHVEDQMDAGVLGPGKFRDLWTWLKLQTV